MSLFGNFKTDGLEETGDRTGGFQLLDSDIYTGTIKALYVGESKSGAMNLNLEVEFDDGYNYRETVYITKKPTAEQKEKGLPGDHFYITKSKKKAPLPGFTKMNELALITTEKELFELGHEEKIHKVYDPDLKKEVPTEVKMVTEAIGKRVSLGIQKKLENKSELQGDKYVATAETREFNEIDKVFHPEYQVTVTEARAGNTKRDFWDKWLTHNKGKVQDRREIKDGPVGNVGARATRAAQAGPPQAGAAAPRVSLFKKPE